MRTTERRGRWSHLDRMAAIEIVRAMDREDAGVPRAVARAAASIARAIETAAAALRAGRRLWTIGAGTSGRLGVLDASECPPTFGADPDEVVAVIAGGDAALRRAIEGAEDDGRAGWRDLRARGIRRGDVLVGISASGATPYVAGALREARRRGVRTVAIAANRGSPVGRIAEIAIEIEVGPEIIAGSTRLKAGTAAKMALNRISTGAMVLLGRVRGNLMVDLVPRSRKLRDRAARIIAEEGGVSRARAARLLERYGSARAALEALERGEARAEDEAPDRGRPRARDEPLRPLDPADPWQGRLAAAAATIGARTAPGGAALLTEIPFGGRRLLAGGGRAPEALAALLAGELAPGLAREIAFPSRARRAIAARLALEPRGGLSLWLPPARLPASPRGVALLEEVAGLACQALDGRGLVARVWAPREGAGRPGMEIVFARRGAPGARAARSALRALAGRLRRAGLEPVLLLPARARRFAEIARGGGFRRAPLRIALARARLRASGGRRGP